MSYIQKLRSFLKNVPYISPLGSLVLKSKRILRGRCLALLKPEGAYLKCNGLEVFCDFNNENYWWYDGNANNLSFDNDVIRKLLSVADGDVYLDIGAHFGYFSAVISNELLSKTNKVTLVAVEPDEHNYACLVKTLNAVNSNNHHIVTLPYAISDTDGIQVMYKSKQPCLHSYAEPGAEKNSDVTAITLNTILEKYAPTGKIAFIKIDIDGAEPLFFRGGWDILKKHKPILFVEFAPMYLRYFGEDVENYFYTLCDNFYVYWISYHNNEAKQVFRSDYAEIIDSVGDMVTDLVLSYKSLDISNLGVTENSL